MDGSLSFGQRHAYGWGCALGSFLWPFLVKRRKTAVENLLRAGIAADELSARRLAKRSFGHFLGHIFEALCVPGVVTAANWREHLDFSEADPETVKLLLDTPEKPILLVSSHHGVWEAATNVLSFARPMYAVSRKLDNRFLANWIEKHHFRGPVTIVDKNRGFTPEVIRGWLASCAAMTILSDQYCHKGAHLRFFGRPARTFTSATRLAMRTGAPVVVGSFVRIAPYRYRLVGGKPLVFPKDGDRDGLTQLLNDRMEAAIRRYPEQYLWVHRRWRDD